MLTQEEMNEYIEMAEKDEWDPERWRFTPNPHKQRLVLVYDVDAQQELALERKAREQGKESSEYLTDVLDNALMG